MKHRPRKRFGQNFLQDANIINAIIASLVATPEQHFVEIGPGLGALTFKLLPHIKQLDVIELDRDLAENLHKIAINNPDLTVHSEDALTFNFRQLSPLPLRIIGNLPYNISTPLIFHLLQYADIINDMCFMLQKEVVGRITAPTNSAAYGRLSVMVQYYCATEHLFDVPPTAFKPQPKVESAIIRLIPHRILPAPASDEILFAKVVKTAFMHPRKILSNNLKNIISTTELENLSITTTQRPQQLSVKDYVTIANYLAIVT